MKKPIFAILIFCFVVGGWYVSSEVYRATAQDVPSVSFTIEQGESVAVLATRLESEQIIRSEAFFRYYLQFKGLDTAVRAGEFVVESPITLARVVAALAEPAVGEKTITLLPGWDLRDMAEYLEAEEVVSEEEFFAVVGTAAMLGNQPVIDFVTPQQPVLVADKPANVSYEGYLRPDTYRIFANATAEEIARKLILAQQDQFSTEMWNAVQQSPHSLHEILTMASLVEREVRSPEDKALVADIFWRRYDLNWALQADSTVHYAVDKEGDLFTTAEDRDSLNPWNTYKYPGLPPGPIAAPSLSSIQAALFPESNGDWYFLTDFEGTVHYASSLDGHNANVQKYLR